MKDGGGESKVMSLLDSYSPGIRLFKDKRFIIADHVFFRAFSKAFSPKTPTKDLPGLIY